MNANFLRSARVVKVAIWTQIHSVKERQNVCFEPIRIAHCKGIKWGFHLILKAKEGRNIFEEALGASTGLGPIACARGCACSKGEATGCEEVYIEYE